MVIISIDGIIITGITLALFILIIGEMTTLLNSDYD
jgi:hypothetical protein